MPLLISIYGDITDELNEKFKKQIPDGVFNYIPTNDICAFDAAIYKSDSIIICSNKNDPLSFLSAYLAEWRVLNKPLQTRPVFVYRNDGDNFDKYCKSFLSYRQNLPDEKNPESKNWFILPTKKVNDFFTMVNNEAELLSKYKNMPKPLEEMASEVTISEKEFKSLKEKFFKAELYESYETYCSAKNDRKPGIFVPAFANDNIITEQLAYSVGKVIANLGFRFINGGPDGGRNANGPMRSSALGANEVGGEILSVYSLPILSKYVTPDKMDCFNKNISILPVATEGQRKKIMLDESTAVIALPGAIGTIAEIEDAIRLGKPVIIVDDKSIHNGKGYWKFYLEYLKEINLIHKVTVIYNDDQLQDRIKNILKLYGVELPRYNYLKHKIPSPGAYARGMTIFEDAELGSKNKPVTGPEITNNNPKL